MINKQEEVLKYDERLITVSYDTMTELTNRAEYITDKLKENITKDHQITKSYISQDENKYYLNFVVSPKYRGE